MFGLKNEILDAPIMVMIAQNGQRMRYMAGNNV